MSRSIYLLTILAALGSAVVGGVFYAFSSFVMSGLDRATPSQAVATMQGINVTALRPGLMIPFIGTALLSVALVVIGVTRRDDPDGWFLVAGGLLYLIGSIVVTIAFHVPRNHALNLVDPGSTEAAARWATYLREWTARNHLRTIASLAAAGAFVAALVRA